MKNETRRIVHLSAAVFSSNEITEEWGSARMWVDSRSHINDDELYLGSIVAFGVSADAVVLWINAM